MKNLKKDFEEYFVSILNGVNSEEALAGNAAGNSEPSLSGDTLEGATTNGRDLRVSNPDTSALAERYDIV